MFNSNKNGDASDLIVASAFSVIIFLCIVTCNSACGFKEQTPYIYVRAKLLQIETHQKYDNTTQYYLLFESESRGKMWVMVNDTTPFRIGRYYPVTPKE